MVRMADIPIPVVDQPRHNFDLAIDDALRRQQRYFWWLDDFQNSAGTKTDRQLLVEAHGLAQQQTQPPAIRLGGRDHNFSATSTTGLNLFPGFAIVGPQHQGIGTIEQGTKGAACRALFNGGNGTQSLFYANAGAAGASIYSPMVCNDIAWYSTNGVSQWLHAPYGAGSAGVNMYGPTWGNLEFTGFYRCIGVPGDGATMTLATMWGAWNIPNMAGTPLTFRGSDNWLVPDEANIGWNNGPAGQYLVRMDNCQKTFVRGLYLTARGGGTRALLVDNGSGTTQGGLYIMDCVIEGQNYLDPAPGALIRVNANGVVNLSNISLNFGMANPANTGSADTGYIMAALGTHGVLNVHDINVTRASTVGQNVPIIAQSGGGRVYVNRIISQPGEGGGQLWTDLPAVTQSAGYMEIDATVRVV